ncbi:MAG: hypothetical protein JNK05_10150 [Myxococcales bacterium]|nr:hypothetical protein [Myxococcales bacterium]
MQLPAPSSAPEVRIRYGRYVARRLRRSKLDALQKTVTAVTDSVKAAGRAREDAAELVDEAIADRDGADDDLDEQTQELRNALAGRSLEAVNESPYTDIFPDGIGYYIGAPLDEQVDRYTQLIERIEKALPASDSERKKRVPALRAALKEFRVAEEALDKARRVEAEASRAVATATDRFNRQLERCYGALVAEQSKSAAERYFPRVRRGKAKRGPAPEPSP